MNPASLVGSTSIPRYVFDTNTLVSAAILPQSVPDIAVRYGFANGRVLTAKPLLQEVTRILNKSKFDRYVGLEERERFLRNLATDGTQTTITVQLQVVRDAKDNFILELAVSGGASTIISGDKDLLALGHYDSVSIRTPAQFLQDHGQP